MVSVQLSRQLDCCQCRHRRLQHLLGRTNFPPLSMFSDKNSKEALKLESGRLGFDALDCGFTRLRMTGMAYLWMHLWVIFIFTSWSSVAWLLSAAEISFSVLAHLIHVQQILRWKMFVSKWQLDHKVLPQLNLDIVSLLHVWHGCLGRATTRTSLQALQPWILTRGRPAQECTIYVRVYKQVCEIKDFRLSMSCSFIHSETPLQQGIVSLANLPGIIDARQVLSLTIDSVHGSMWGNQTLAQETSGNLFLSAVFRCIVTLVRGLCFGSPPRWHHDVCTRRAVSKAPPRLPWPGEACILGL